MESNFLGCGDITRQAFLNKGNSLDFETTFVSISKTTAAVRYSTQSLSVYDGVFAIMEAQNVFLRRFLIANFPFFQKWELTQH